MTKDPKGTPDEFTTIEVARMLGMSVRSVQMMVDRGDFEAWKTPGGHRRIARASVEKWRGSRNSAANVLSKPHAKSESSESALRSSSSEPARVLLIDDSVHSQKLVSLLMRQHFPMVDLQIADDGVAGLVMYGMLQPQVLIVDILLPGIDGATLITSLRSHSQFAQSNLVVITSLDEQQRAPYAFALEHVPVIHKPRLVAELPSLLAQWLPWRESRASLAATG